MLRTVLLPFMKGSCGPIQHKLSYDPCSHAPKEFKHWPCSSLILLCAGKSKRCVHNFAAKDTVGSINEENMILDHT